ncbi:MAG: hypothetical protein CM15mP9_1900 [Methanobacteriota archaeon]|nr:MAG: hypothetical protein CM15mP9_1900 [Euryarchaeota archaeon]
MTFFASSVGEDAAEPSIGITSTGCVFFIAFEKVMRSCDYGGTWEQKNPVACSPTTSDPYGWVDPITQVFGVQMIGLKTSWICWSDDGETWLGNPPILEPSINPTSNSPPALGQGGGYGAKVITQFRNCCILLLQKFWAFSFSPSFDGGQLSTQVA